MRGRTVPRYWRVGEPIDLSLPHVPESIRQFLCAAGFGNGYRSDMDARRTKTVSVVRTTSSGDSAPTAEHR